MSFIKLINTKEGREFLLNTSCIESITAEGRNARIFLRNSTDEYPVAESLDEIADMLGLKKKGDADG